MAQGEVQEYIKYKEYIQKIKIKPFSKKEIKQNERKSDKDVIDEPFYPADLTLSIFAATVYNEKLKKSLFEGLEELKRKRGIVDHVKEIIEQIQQVGEWKLLTWAENSNDDYFGAAFWNGQRNQLVISHRGTVPKWDKRKTALTDLQGPIFNQYTSQIHSACVFSAFILQDLDQTKISISITGHSLGAWLAQITTFTSEYLTLQQEIFTGRTGSPRNPKSQIHAVVFDSPGCYEMLSQIAGHYYDRYEHEAYTLLSALDVTIYFNIPNLVNSVNSHHGIRRLLQIRETPEDVNSESNITWHDLDSHKATNFIRMLSSTDNVNIWTVLNWPSFGFPDAVKKKKSNRPLSLSKSMTKIIALIVSSVEVLTSPENELVNHYKNIQEDGEDGSKIGGISKMYNVAQIDNKCQPISIFSEEQIAFLKYWKRVRDEKVAPDKFKNIQKILENNKLEDYYDFLPLFDFYLDESKKTMVRCSSEQDLQKVIRRVKHLLAMDPRAFHQMKKDSEELLKSYEKLYESHSESYLQTLPALDVDFIDIYDILEFLKSKENVLALITKNNTKYEMFRIRNLLQHFDLGQCYLSLAELEQIALHVDILKIFNDPECRVDRVMTLDCEAKKENQIKKELKEIIKTAKYSKQNDKKLILILNDNNDWLKNILEKLEITTDEVEYSFLDFTEKTKQKLFSKEIVTQWNKKMKLAKFLNVINSKQSAQEQIDFLSHPDVLFSLLTAKYSDVELSSRNVINHDNLKVLTVDLQKTIEINWLAGFLKTKPNNLEKIFGKPIIFMVTGILKAEFENNFEKNLPHVKFADNFADLCRKNMYKRIYWIHFPSNDSNSIELRKIFDPDFYIERRMLKQIVINKTMFAKLLKEKNEVSLLIVCNISREIFFQVLNMDETEIKAQKLSSTLEIMAISTNMSVAITEEIDEAVEFFNSQMKNSVNLFKYKECCQKFIWKSSKGSLDIIRGYVSFDKSVVLNELDLTEVSDKVVIIAGESGVGKSTILLRYAKKLTSSWVIRVKLVDYRKKIDNINDEVNLDNVVEFLLKNNENSLNPFIKSLLKFNLTHETQTPVVIFFDGYDEIVREEIQIKMLTIFQFLQEKTNARIWITTKIWAKNLLEDTLSVFSTQIEGIDIDQQKKFIKNFWLAGFSVNIKNRLSKKILDDKAEELYTKSERSLIIQRHLSLRDCSKLEKAWDILVGRRYDSASLDDLMKHINTLYELVKDGQKQFLEENLMMAIIHLVSEEKARKDLIEFINILNFAWYIDPAQNLYSQRYLKETYLESQMNSTSREDENLEELATRKTVEIFIKILSLPYETEEYNLQQSYDILAIPLQLRMMGETLQRQSDSMATMQIPENLLKNHYELYKQFISIKFNIYNKGKLKKNDERKSAEKTLGERHQNLAIKLLFPDQYQKIFEDDVLDLKEESWKEDIIKMNQIGIINMSDSGTFTFTHISFAEYFTADKIYHSMKKKFSSNVILEDLIMTDILLKDENILTRKFLDGMLKNTPQLIFHFFEKKFSDSAVNKIGESALHLCASENLTNLAGALLNSFENENLFQKFMGISNIIYETALHYTAANNQLDFATLLLKRNPKENVIKFEATQATNLFPEGELHLDTQIHFSFAVENVHAFIMKDDVVSDITSYDKENLPQLLQKVLAYNKINEMSDSSLCVLLNFAIKHKFPELALKIINDRPNSLFSGPISKILHHASEKGLKDVVLRLIDLGADINTTECDCQSTPLYKAAKNGHWDLVTELIDLGAKVDVPCSANEETVLHLAAFIGQLDIILKLLLKGARINAIEKEKNYSPITAAAANSHWDVVLKLLEFGANPNIPALQAEFTVLHFAAFRGPPKEAVIKLLDAGANIDAIEQSAGYTPMMSNAVEKRWDIVMEMINRGGNVNIPTFKCERTMLHYAAMHGVKEVVIALLDAGADINAVELTDGVVAINMAAVNDEWDTVSELIKRGANVNIPLLMDPGNTVLHYAAQEGELNIVIELIEHRADINAINKFNWTPLNLAAERSHWDIVSVLLQHGADIDALSNGRQYLFEKADEAGKLEWLAQIVYGK